MKTSQTIDKKTMLSIEGYDSIEVLRIWAPDMPLVEDNIVPGRYRIKDVPDTFQGTYEIMDEGRYNETIRADSVIKVDFKEKFKNKDAKVLVVGLFVPYSHGGKRKGAGRKQTYNAKVPVSCRVLPKTKLAMEMYMDRHQTTLGKFLDSYFEDIERTL